jgi:putative spermidine/putrescine transport system permease protein/spermidine/putrescine transport system permease protein
LAGVLGLGSQPDRGGRAAAQSALRGLLPLLPLVAFLLVFFVYPVIRILLLSVEPTGPLLTHFQELWTQPLYRAVLIRTFRLSLTVTALCLLLGYPVAYTIAHAPPRWAGVLITLVLIPFWISVLGRSFTWMVVLQRNGIVNQVLKSLGLISEPLSLVYNSLGVHIGMTHILLPFMILSSYSVMRGISPSLIKAATTLGANEWQTFSRVYFPLSVPGVLAGTLVVFVVGLGFFITPALLGGGKVTTVSLLIEATITQTLNWGLASALAFVLLLSALMVLVPAMRVLNLDRVFGGAR